MNGSGRVAGVVRRGRLLAHLAVVLPLGAAGLAAQALAAAPAAQAATTTKFFCTGAEQTYSVPAGVRALKIKAIGAAGAPSASVNGVQSGPGGQGAIVGAWVPLLPTISTVYVEVGCAGSGGSGGFNGGGSTSQFAGGGGGASDVRLTSISQVPDSSLTKANDSRMVVAGGGGGGGACKNPGSGPPGGAGGIINPGNPFMAGNGGAGADNTDCSGATAGGNGSFFATSGGTGAPGTACAPFAGGNGLLGQGGGGGDDPNALQGAGGGGQYGGGGGGDGCATGGGGGAGSGVWPLNGNVSHTRLDTNTTGLAPEVMITPACLVPRLKGRKLAAATTALTNARCALGTVTFMTSTGPPGIVLSQNPTAKKILTAGSKVSVVVSQS